MRSPVLPACALLSLAFLAGCAGGSDAAKPGETSDGQVLLGGVVVTPAIVPIAGATVTVAPGDLSNVTDANGEFLIGPLEPGAYVLSVAADGYAPQRTEVQVAPGMVRPVLVLDATSTTVPYHELLHFEAFIECSYAQNFAGTIGGDFSCFGVTDLVLQVEIDNDVNNFPFTVNAGGFKGLLYEMVWEPQDTMPNFAGFIRNPLTVGQLGGVGQEQQFWADSGESPLRAWVYQGIENDGAYDGDVFHPDANVSADYEILVSGVTSGNQPAEVAIALNQSLDIFVTLFYNALGDDSYTALDPPA